MPRGATAEGLRPLPGTELRIADDDDRPLPHGVTGEIQVRGPTVTRGYWRQPEASARALAGGWLHTGDLGALDPGGALRVLGRGDDMLVTGGENVHPAEVEAVLLAHPDVADAAVAGLPDPDWGRRVAAWIVLGPGARAEAGALERHARTRLAGYKVPRTWRFVAALPATPAASCGGACWLPREQGPAIPFARARARRRERCRSSRGRSRYRSRAGSRS